MARPLPTTLINRVIKLAKRGYKPYEIKEMTGVHSASLSKYFALGGIPKFKPGRLPGHTQKVKDNIITVKHLRSNGRTFQQIGDAMGFSRARAEQLAKL